MGRRRTINHRLPPRMHEKNGRYYHVTGGTKPRRWTALGGDWALALRKYAEIEGEPHQGPGATFADVAKRYRLEVIPRKAPNTQRGNLRELANLNAVFGAVPLGQIKPRDVREYLDVRGAKARARANREKALLSHIFNFARECGYTDVANPCLGVRGFSEPGRNRYVTDAEYLAVWSAADDVVRDIMDLCYRTAQRPGDVLKMLRTDIQNGVLSVAQDKTGKCVRIEVTGFLEQIIERIEARSRTRAGVALVRDADGQPISRDTLRSRFDAARDKAGVSFQLRDLRAKAATDLNDLPHAQRLLGHARRNMTEHYAGRRGGEKVSPVNRKLEGS